MKKIIGLFIISFIFNHSLYASPLIFKTTKEVNTSKGAEIVELALVDTSKYRQIRVAIISNKNSERDGLWTGIYGLEEGQEIFIAHQRANPLNFTTVIDSPPTKLKIQAQGNAIYNVYIWGQ